MSAPVEADPSRDGGGAHAVLEELHLASCWGCGTRVQLPVIDGAPAQTFKCGWCGAMTEPPGPPPRPPPSRSKESARVAVVVAVILTITALGVIFVLPTVGPRFIWLHTAFSAWLVFNVLFNYAAAVSKDPGIVRCKVSNARPVDQGALDGYTYCDRCEVAKAPDTHHCRTCRGCICGMDHHCVFIGNCVGADNRRWFIVFLYWTVLACFYLLILTALLLWRRADAVAASWHAFRQHFHWTGALLTLWWIIKVSPGWLVATLYLMCSATSLVMVAGMLLQQQLLFVLTGISVVDALKIQSGTPRQPVRRRTLRQRLAAIFGEGPAWMWLLPAWQAPVPRRYCDKGC